MKTLKMKHGTLRAYNGYVTVEFEDGTKATAIPHPHDHHYYVIAHRCGYGDDIFAYCIEHEFVHMFLAQELCDSPCPILWELAHGGLFPSHAAVLWESLTQTFQRWLRASEEPIIGGADWGAMKAKALVAINGWEHS